ncbi:LytR family transcriptional regulator [Saccharopolyspora rhizosphaerae]|uniref:LytR family transcriptional regulator n=2 Tax=Saccharopolyspora rhizosphaerae TaxID=2492662 RepID=A0A3R8R8E9_9PSEU|nr:LytR family transcriptional regulator [Saccharopolyspora rhizosphaerae]
MSLVILLVTGYGWSNYRHLLAGLATSDVAEGGGADGAVDILLVGMDSRTDAHGNPLPEEVLRELHAGASDASLTDTIIMLHIPNDGTSAVGFSFPRDSYVSIPGQGQHKINSAYGRGKEAEVVSQQRRGVTDRATLEREGNEAGRKVLLRTVENLTGSSIDHYAEVNLLGFAEITEAVGGVPVCLNSDTSDSFSGADFKAGKQTISGPDALAFVRQRHGLPRGDLDRVVRQQAFLAGLAQTALSGGVLANPNKLRELINSVQDSVVLDLGEESDVLAFAERLRGLAGGAIKFNTIPIEDAAYDTPDGEALKVDPRAVKAAVRASTLPPGAPGSPAPTPPPTSETAGTESQEPVSARVDVLNGTRTTGLAAKVQDQLGAQGIDVGSVGNASKRSSSVVRYGSGAGAAAHEVASLLGGMPTESDSSLASGRVQVLIGSDYDGPAGPRFSPGGTLALDGTARQQQDPETPDQAPISAAGVPCVN